jgi:alkylation response protein AidB-like acyl-CoA dehydrogenase
MSVTVTRETMNPQELEALREALREVCLRHAGPDEARRLLDGSPGAVPSPELWRALTTDLGVGGLVVPERFGGADAGWNALRVVLEELGRGLAGTAYVPSAVLATTLLLALHDDDASAELLPGIADGSVVATVGAIESGTGWDDWTHERAPAAAATSAFHGVDGWRVSGTKRVVPFAATADLLLVTADAGDGAGVFVVERAGDGVSTRPLTTLDGTRPVADVVLADAAARLVGAVGASGAAVRRTLDLGALATSAQDVGAMRACLEMSVEYAKLRTQFDRPIGSFQAVKHKLADMLVRVELAEAAVEEAALLADDDTAEAGAAAAVAHATTAEAYRLVASETIQTHGGIGFTWEHPAHLHFRRAKTSQLAFGGPARYRERLLDRLGLGLPAR